MEIPKWHIFKYRTYYFWSGARCTLYTSSFGALTGYYVLLSFRSDPSIDPYFPFLVALSLYLEWFTALIVFLPMGPTVLLLFPNSQLAGLLSQALYSYTSFQLIVQVNEKID